MPILKKDISLRSDEIQDIVERKPRWVIRWGITVIFSSIILVLFLCWLIRYPELISGTIKISTVVQPVKIVSQSSGNITQLFVSDGDDVEAGTILAEIENPLSASAVKYVTEYLTQLNRAIEMKSPRLPLPDTLTMALGELQPILSSLNKDISNINMRRTYKIDAAGLLELKLKIDHQKELLVINSRMLEIENKEMENARLKFESETLLYRDKVISKQDYFQSQTAYNSKAIQLEQMQQSQVQNKVLLNNLEFQLSQAGYNKDAKESETIETIKSYKAQILTYIYGWQQRFRLVAVKAGKIAFLQNLQPNLYLKAGEEVFALIDPTDSLVAFAEIPLNGFGKVKVGQTVNVSLENFPYEEYGVINGKVQNIALLPNKTFYRVEISLTNGMHTSRGFILKFTPEMSGRAEIITDDKTIFDRIFRSLLKIFQQK